MDKYHHIEYIKSKYIPVFLILIWAILFAVSIVFIFNINYVKMLYSKNLLLLTIMIFLYLFVSLFLFYIFGIKIFTRKMNIIMQDEYFDINEGKKIIYYRDIKTLKLETIKNIRYNTVTGYTFVLDFNNENILINVYTGTSKKGKSNCDTLIKFYEELSKKYNEDNIRHHCT
jgi:hypothetical protein